MADRSRIGWTGATWNIVTGCTRVSEGCDRCYIERTPPLRMAGRKFDKPGSGGTTEVILHPERMGQPLRWRSPRLVFVNSLGDLFHDDVPEAFIGTAFRVMADAPQHTFQVLTKRPGRMRSMLASWAAKGSVDDLGYLHGGRPTGSVRQAAPLWTPPANVWLGTSVENQKWANVRIPAVLGTPAAARWISAEPLLGPIDLRCCNGVDAIERDWIGGPGGGSGAPHPLLNWVVVGGESGAGHRVMDLAAAESLVKQCRDAGVPVFVKQDSGPRPGMQGRLSDELWALKEYPHA